MLANGNPPDQIKTYNCRCKHIIRTLENRCHRFIIIPVPESGHIFVLLLSFFDLTVALRTLAEPRDDWDESVVDGDLEGLMAPVGRLVRELRVVQVYPRFSRRCGSSRNTDRNRSGVRGRITQVGKRVRWRERGG